VGHLVRYSMMGTSLWGMWCDGWNEREGIW
jgi:hypothetical protein